MRHGRCEHKEHSSRWVSRLLTLCCFSILLLGAAKHLYSPHLAGVAQIHESLHSHSDKASVAHIPDKLRIRNDSLKQQADDNPLQIFKLHSDDGFLSNVFPTLMPPLLHQSGVNGFVPNDRYYFGASLPPSRAPPST
ncbi:hypothetical protein ACT3RP_06185 [Halomonas sp. AOP5-B2-8]